MPTTSTLTEVVFVVHFQAPLNLQFRDINRFFETFKDFPVPQQTKGLPPVDITTIGGQPQVFMELPGAHLPRLILRSKDHPLIVQIQEDRFGFSWSRVGDLGSVEAYPGFDRLVEMFSDNLIRLDKWSFDCFGAPLRARLAEVTYFNSLPAERNDGLRWRLSEVFAFVSPGVRSVNAFAATWTEMLEQNPVGARVVANIGIGGFAAAQTSVVQNVLFFHFSGYAGLENVALDDPSIGGSLGTLHARILDMYHSAITAQARQ